MGDKSIWKILYWENRYSPSSYCEWIIKLTYGNKNFTHFNLISIERMEFKNEEVWKKKQGGISTWNEVWTTLELTFERN